MSGTPRQQARARTLAEIVRLGRRQLTEVGPADLSLRAVARDLGVVSSAVYRYVRNRDELLTLLIVDAYDELGDAVEAADARAVADAGGSGDAGRRRLHAVADAARRWALGEPQRFALLHGTPVPGYQAPRDRTVAPGTRLVLTLARILEASYVAGVLATSDERLPAPLRADLEAIRDDAALTMPAEAVARGLAVWSGLIGLIAFDVFDAYGADTVTDRDALFTHQVDLLAEIAGLP